MIDLSAGVNVTAMIANAVSSGNGGTILNTGLGTIDLVGIEPSEVSADWFV